jgi:DNA helicase-2/ATP-dependent DNA helicase PcrA
LIRLNHDNQRRAVEHGVETVDHTPLLVLAGAGSGKTHTLAHRVAHLVVNGADPRRILLLTFSRRGAVELSRRVERIVGGALDAKAGTAAACPWAGTFHAIGARLLRDYAGEIGLGAAFTIHDRADSADLIDLVRHELGLSGSKNRFPMKTTCLAIYSRAVNAQTPLESILAKAFPWCKTWESELRSLFSAYVEAKQRQGLLDYDDLLLYWAQMMSEPAIAADLAGRFDHVLVDEYQDTNRLQASILLALKPDGRGLTVVGDDAQSIYSFRAASVRNILDFPASFSPAARVVTLERNYRSTQAILAASNAVIGLASERFTKNLWSDRLSSLRPALISVRDEADQARYIVERILDNRENGIALKTQAVLFRAAHHSGSLEVELTRRNIPFVKFGGLKFLDAAHIKDALACLRFAENPRDRVAGFRVVQLLSGIGPAIAGRILDLLQEAEPFTALERFSAPARAAEDWPNFVELLRQLRRGRSEWPADLGLVRRWYEPIIEQRFDDVDARRADLLQLEGIAATYSSREQFLTELTLDPPAATSAEAGAPLLDEDYLILSTIHSAKGQEWSAVFVLNAVDGCIPSDLAIGASDEIEEERRLLYVAMTRAKNHLDLILPQRFYTHQQAARGDRHVYAARTRFIPKSILSYFDQQTWPALAPQAAGTTPTPKVRLDIGARMRDMWR